MKTTQDSTALNDPRASPIYSLAYSLHFVTQPLTFILYSDDCKVGKKRKTGESDCMVSAEPSEKKTKTQGKDKVIYDVTNYYFR